MSKQENVQSLVTEADIEVKLNAAEERAIAMLSPALQTAARAEMLTRKTANRLAYLNSPEVQARLARDNQNRKVFGIKTYESGAIGVTGLGRKFPVVLHKGEWLILLENIEAIQEYVEAAPDTKRS